MVVVIVVIVALLGLISLRVGVGVSGTIIPVMVVVRALTNGGVSCGTASPVGRGLMVASRPFITTGPLIIPTTIRVLSRWIRVSGGS